MTLIASLWNVWKEVPRTMRIAAERAESKTTQFSTLTVCGGFTFPSPQSLQWLNLLPIADLQVSKNLKRKDRSTFSHFSPLSQSLFLYLEGSSLYPGQLSGTGMLFLVHKRPQACLTWRTFFFLSSKENNQIWSQDATGFVFLKAETLVSLQTDPTLPPWGIDVRAVDQEHPFTDSHSSAACKPFCLQLDLPRS